MLSFQTYSPGADSAITVSWKRAPVLNKLQTLWCWTGFVITLLPSRDGIAEAPAKPRGIPNTLTSVNGLLKQFLKATLLNFMTQLS